MVKKLFFFKIVHILHLIGQFSRIGGLAILHCNFLWTHWKLNSPTSEASEIVLLSRTTMFRTTYENTWAMLDLLWWSTFYHTGSGKQGTQMQVTKFIKAYMVIFRTKFENTQAKFGLLWLYIVYMENIKMLSCLDNSMKEMHEVSN